MPTGPQGPEKTGHILVRTRARFLLGCVCRLKSNFQGIAVAMPRSKWIDVSVSQDEPESHTENTDNTSLRHRASAGTFPASAENVDLTETCADVFFNGLPTQGFLGSEAGDFNGL
jgi:hypothetical protein